MHTPTSKRGFTLIELLVVIAIIAILASILFPIFAKAREKARQTQCTSNLRQLAMAVTMFTQDNQGRYPGMYVRQADGTPATTVSGWAKDTITYVKGGDTSTTSKNEMFYCPSMTSSDNEMPIGYAYNSYLLRTDGTGVGEGQVKSPTQVGVLCDAEPGIKFMDGGGIIGGFDLLFATQNDRPKYTMVPSPRHNKGCIVGYADGHAAIVPEKFNVKDCTNGVTRAFYMAGPMMLVDNPAAGCGNFTPTTPVSTAITMGGDACMAPLMMAAAETWKKVASGFTYTTDGFVGSVKTDSRPADFLWADATGFRPTTGATSVMQPVARDAVVIIVNKNCTITKNSYIQKTTLNNNRGTMWTADVSNIQKIFASDGFQESLTTVTDMTVHDWQVYTFDKYNGTRKFMNNSGTVKGYAFRAYSTGHSNDGQNTDYSTTSGGHAFIVPDDDTNATDLVNANGATHRAISADTYRGIYVNDDVDMVDKVAADPLGIGYCSAAFADQKRVSILALANAGAALNTAATFPNGTQARVDMGVYPTNLGSTGSSWPYYRTLYVYAGGTAASANAIGPVMFLGTAATQNGTGSIAGWTALKKSPLFQASYWLPFNN